MRFNIFCFLACMTLGATLYAQQERIALVIGVKSYQNVPPLQNSLNDAMDMAATLKEKGFTVVEVYDPPDKKTMREGIIRYLKMLEGKSEPVGLVYYSGHGMQVDGKNFLIPTKASLEIKTDLDDQCIDMDYLLGAMEKREGNGLNVFIVDACRNNPFRSFTRSGEMGLGSVNAPQGSYIVYATKPGSVASDGTGSNGLFTSKLLKYMNTEGLSIEQMFKYVARDVGAESGNDQRPWISSDYTGDFSFTPGGKFSLVSTQPPAEPKPAEVVPAARKRGKESPVEIPLDDGYGTDHAPIKTIGSQTWIIRNLNVDIFSNGDPIPEVRDASAWVSAGKNKTPAWSYYENNPENGTKFGKLYNWYAVTDPRGLCPEGWHVPSDEEWTKLTDYLGSKSVAGTGLKSTTGWSDFKGKSGNGNNQSGFTGLPGGYRFDDGDFNGIGRLGYWWTSLTNGDDGAWNRNLDYDDGDADRDLSGKGIGFSVRCLRDK